MFYYILIFILLIIVVLIIFKGRERVIIYKARKTKHTEKKEARKKEILELIKEKGKITNDEVQELLNVSHASATNYLDELEKQGKIKQMGKEGRSVYYKITQK